jgi:D-tyrosyl-tRNA(Tyr) deacylase
MRVVIQRVKSASVNVGGQAVGSIGQGLMVLVGIGRDDTVKDAEWIADKIVNLRIFETEEGKLDKSLLDVGGELLLVSQFTLYGDCRKGRRPSFSDAMEADKARAFFEAFVEMARTKGPRVETGVFQAMMDVTLVNDGPVTLLLDSQV